MTARFPVTDVLLHDDAFADLAQLDLAKDKTSVTNRTKARALRGVLLKDPLHGEVVPRKKIPRALKERYGLDNLYVEDLADFWRLLYTIQKEAGQAFVTVLRIVDHGQYDKWFPSKGK
jgi:hypothetical protein